MKCLYTLRQLSWDCLEAAAYGRLLTYSFVPFFLECIPLGYEDFQRTECFFLSETMLSIVQHSSITCSATEQIIEERCTMFSILARYAGAGIALYAEEGAGESYQAHITSYDYDCMVTTHSRRRGRNSAICRGTCRPTSHVMTTTV